jgi:4-amino-4-deoxy-L-arabinose transferase-like glycosyltransferase
LKGTHLTQNVKNLQSPERDALSTAASSGRVGEYTIRSVVAAAALALAGMAQQQLTSGQQTVTQLVLLIGAALAFGFAVPSDAIPLAPLFTRDASRAEYRLRSDRMSLILSAFVLAMSLFLFWQDRQRGTAFIIWFAAMIWFVTSYLTGISQLWSRRRRFQLARPGIPAVAACAILLGVAIVDFWDLGSIPYGLWWDEANFGLYAQQILHHTIDFPLLAPFGDPSLEFYLHAIEQLIFGATEFSTRVLVAVCGILGVALLGVLSSILWNRWVALTAMVVLGFMRWHIDFSRFGIHEMTFQAFELAVVVTLIAGIKQRKPVWFALCGVLLGLSIHIYSPAFALTFLVLLTLAYGYLFLRPRLTMSLIALVFVGFVIAYAPLLEAGIQNPTLFNARAKQVSVFGPNNQYPPLQALEHNLRAHAIMFNVDGDHNGRHNIPGQPQLDDISALLFVLGAAWVAMRAGRPQYAFLVFWFLAMMAPGVLSLDFEAPQSGRAAGAQPIVALFITLALCGSVALLGRTVDGFMPRVRISRILMPILVLPVLALVSVSNISAYFDGEVHNESVWEVWAADATFVGKELATLPTTETTYISPEFSGHPSVAYLAPGHATGASLNPAADLPFLGSGPIAVFLSRNDHFYAPLLKAYYPKAQERVLQGPELTTPPLAYEVRLSKSDVTGIQGLNFRYFGKSGVTRAHVTNLTFPRGTPAGPGLAIWTGGVRIAHYGQATLSVEAPGRIAVTLDGRTLCVGQSSVACSKVWVQGNHSLQVRVNLGPSSHPRIVWQWSGLEKPAFFVVPLMGHGLTASYYSNGSWHGRPAFVQREPQVDYYYQVIPLPRPFSVMWRGSLYVPTTGQYTFALDSVDDSSISIDGAQVLHVAGNLAGTKTTTLTRGWHRVAVRLLAVNSFTHIFLTWMPPGNVGLTPVPSEDFRP